MRHKMNLLAKPTPCQSYPFCFLSAPPVDLVLAHWAVLSLSPHLSAAIAFRLTRLWAFTGNSAAWIISYFSNIWLPQPQGTYTSSTSSAPQLCFSFTFCFSVLLRYFSKCHQAGMGKGPEKVRMVKPKVTGWEREADWHYIQTTSNQL